MAVLSPPDPPLSDGVVTLRPLRPEDGDAVVAALQDPSIPQWTNVPSPYTAEDWRDWLVESAQQMQTGTGMHLIVADAADETRVLGVAGLNSLDLGAGVGDIGYWTAKEARGRGVAVRATRLLGDWAREHLGLDPVLYIHVDNGASQRVAAAAGYRDAGERAACPRGCGDDPDHIVFRR